MCCRSEWQERMYIYKWHEVDQTKHEIFCVHIVCNEIQVKVNLEITTFFFYLRFPYCPNFFWFGVVQYNPLWSVMLSTLTVNWCLVLFMTYWHKVQMIFNSRFVASSVDFSCCSRAWHDNCCIQWNYAIIESDPFDQFFAVCFQNTQKKKKKFVHANLTTTLYCGCQCVTMQLLGCSDWLLGWWTNGQTDVAMALLCSCYSVLIAC